MNNKNLLRIILFLVLFCSINYIFILNIPLIQVNQLNSSENDVENYLFVESTQLTKILNPRSIVEHAIQVNSSQSITSYYFNNTNLTTLGQAFNDLAPGWECNQLDVAISNLYENRTWLKDPGFEYNGNWSIYNTSRLDFYGDWIVEIADGVGMNSSKGVHIMLNRTEDGGDDSSLYTYLTEAAYRQILSINRSNINSAGLQFDYKVNLDPTWSLETSGTFSISVEINQDFENYRPDKYYTYWSYMDNGIPSEDLIKSHDIVIWDCGSDSTTTLEEEDRNLLGSYLNDEGKLFLTGHGIAYDSSGEFDTWLTEYLHASYSGYHSDVDTVTGPTGGIYENISAVEVLGGPDYLTVETGGEISFEYDGKNTNQKDAAINWNSLTYNNATVFSAFSFEYIVGKNNRIDILNATLNYLNSSCKSVLFVDDTNNEYGYYHTDALEDLGFDRIWKRVFTKPFFEIEEENEWYNTGIVSVPLQYLPRNSTHVNLDIKIGIKHAGSVTNTPDPTPEIWVDNFDFYLKSNLRPSDINLTMNGLQTVDEQFGSGNYSQTTTTPFINNIVVSNFTWNPNPLPNPEQDFYISFDCISTINCTKKAESTYYLDKKGVSLNVESSENASWSFFYWNIIPTGYENHYLNISKPIDWNITYVAAPLNQSINMIENCTGVEPGSAFLIVPTQNNTNFPDGYWFFNATSFNYHNDLKIQAWNGIDWNDETEYFVGNMCRIKLQVLNETGGVPPDLSAYSANLTIIDPELNVWYYNETFYSDIDGLIYFPNLTINGSDTFGGNYEINVAWTNGEEICYRSATFTIKHSANLILYKPNDALIDAETIVTYGDLLLIRMRLNDTDKNELIKGSNLTLNWTNGGPTIRNFTDLDTGEYELILDTSELLEIKNYTLIINTTHDFYSNDTFSLKLVVLADTILTSPQFPRVSEPWGENITIDYFYNLSIGGTGINEAIYKVEYPGIYTMYDLTSGHYQLELNTSTVSINEHKVNVSFQKPNLYPQNLTIKVNIHEKETKLIQDTISAVPHGDNVTIIVRYSTLDNTPIEPDENPENIISLNSSLMYNVVYDNGGDQKYHITLNTSNLNKYDVINITAQKNKYYAQSLLSLIPYREIFLEIVPLNSTFIELPNNVTYTNLTLYLNDTEHNRPINSANFTFIGFSEINATFIGNGIYRITLNSGNVVMQPYNILIIATPENYLQDSLQIILQVKNWSNFYTISSDNETVQTITQGASITLNYRFYNKFYGKNETNSVYYSWIFGSGTLLNLGNGYYSLDIATNGRPAGTYQLKITVNNSEGVLLASQTITIVIQSVSEPLPWWVQYSWIFGPLVGVAAAIIALIAGYFTRNKLREKGWEKKIKHIYVLHTQNGAPLFDRHVGETQKLDSGLVTSALLGISSILHEIVQSKEKTSRLKSIDHMDQKILFSHGYHVTGAIMSSVDLPIIRNKLNEFTQTFEKRYAKDLKNFQGETAPFIGAKKIVNEIFPFEKVAENLEITAQWAIDNIIEIYGTISMEILQTIGFGLTDLEHIQAGTGMAKEKLEPLIRTFGDLNLIDSNNKITKKGKAAIKIFKEEKERYFDFKKIMEREMD
ncbi:MAG: hypothetical protein EAX96_16015 [Candidatus Lokiarchaeota archaeon]|nr:hypothetical protein [Candidatus Lokiarchaeota archaeon]